MIITIGCCTCCCHCYYWCCCCCRCSSCCRCLVTFVISRCMQYMKSFNYNWIGLCISVVICIAFRILQAMLKSNWCQVPIFGVFRVTAVKFFKVLTHKMSSGPQLKPHKSVGHNRYRLSLSLANLQLHSIFNFNAFLLLIIMHLIFKIVCSCFCYLTGFLFVRLFSRWPNLSFWPFCYHS